MQGPDAVRAGIVDARDRVLLLRAKHAAYCRAGLNGLSRYMVALDASRPWLCYWMMFAIFSCLEYVLDTLFASWMPLWFELKIFFVFVRPETTRTALPHAARSKIPLDPVLPGAS